MIMQWEFHGVIENLLIDKALFICKLKNQR